MSRNATAPAVPNGPTPGRQPGRDRALTLLRFLGAYLLGIGLCVILTPVTASLAGATLWPYYPLFAMPGLFLFYFYLSDPYLPDGGSSLIYWLWFFMGLIPLVVGAMTYFPKKVIPDSWRPLLIGAPVGFVGTLGVYFTAAASI